MARGDGAGRVSALVETASALSPTPRTAAVAAWALTAAGAGVQLLVAHRHHDLGLDFRPLYRAGQAVLDGRSIYAVPAFVYPPPAAVAATVLARWPLAWLVPAMLVLELVVLVVLAAVTVSWLVPRPWRAAVAGLAATALVWSHPAAHALWLENVSVPLALVALGVVWLFGTDRWWAGSVLLVASLLLKPLLVPLALIPLLLRRPRPLLLAGAGGAVVLAVSAMLTTGLGRLPAVVRLLADGSVLVGARAVDNLSLAGFASAHGLPTAVSAPARLAVVGVIGWTCWVLWRRRPTLDVRGLACLATALYLALLLAGSLSEVHYVFVALPGGFAAWALSRSPLVRAAVAVGAAATFFPVRNGAPGLHQDLLVLLEVAFFVATVAALLAPAWAATGQVGGRETATTASAS